MVARARQALRDGGSLLLCSNPSRVACSLQLRLSCLCCLPLRCLQRGYSRRLGDGAVDRSDPLVALLRGGGDEAAPLAPRLLKDVQAQALLGAVAVVGRFRVRAALQLQRSLD